MEILDIHTHHEAPQPSAVVAIRLSADREVPKLLNTQLYSSGVHPWDTTAEISDKEWTELEALVAKKQVVALGECGVDLTPKGGPLFRQLQVLKRQIEISERLGMPMVIHDVKGHDLIVGMRRDLKPTQNWVIHGFRRKPEVARMLLRAGCWLSFGPQFNTDSVRETPEDRILAETDESDTTIDHVIESLSAAYGKDLKPIIAENTKRFLGINKRYIKL